MEAHGVIEPIRLLRGGRDKNVYVLSRLRPARYGLGVGGDAYPSLCPHILSLSPHEAWRAAAPLASARVRAG